ncbi:MAG: PIN domain-containing protein [Anaerolineales bacterium]|nr:PIN domain-containing protein [Anaerolineales bacterium]
MNGLVDTTVLVDVLRGYSVGVEWVRRQGMLAISPLVWMELIDGVTNKKAQFEAYSLLSHYYVVFLTEADIQWAMEKQLRYKLSHNVGIYDCLIASVNYRLQLPLYTRNLKHFRPLLGELAQQPY